MGSPGAIGGDVLNSRKLICFDRGAIGTTRPGSIGAASKGIAKMPSITMKQGHGD
jgi:hypothetical protein